MRQERPAGRIDGVSGPYQAVYRNIPSLLALSQLEQFSRAQFSRLFLSLFFSSSLPLLFLSLPSTLPPLSFSSYPVDSSSIDLDEGQGALPLFLQAIERYAGSLGSSVQLTGMSAVLLRFLLQHLPPHTPLHSRRI